VTHEDAFLHDIIENPDDDGPRLVYADWLDDHGEPDRARFIRVQCELAGLPEGNDPRRVELEVQEKELRDRHGGEWFQPFSELSGSGWWTRRGFVEGATFLARDFIRRAPDLFRRHPLRHVHLVETVKVRALSQVPQLVRLATLSLKTTGDIGDRGAAVLAACPYLAGLARLGLACNDIGDRGVGALAGSPHLAGLHELELALNRVGDAGATALASSPHLARLTYLGLWHNGVGLAGCQGLALSPYLGRLERLELAENHIGQAGRRALKGRFGDRVNFNAVRARQDFRG
jgi:uncharacterized protein (TIGR02996 family)